VDIPLIWYSLGILSAAVAQTNGAETAPSINSTNDLIQAAFEGDSQKISRLLAEGVEVNANTGPGLTAWQAARIKGHRDIMDLLVKKGADTNAVSPNPKAVLDWYVKQKVGPGSPGVALAIVKDGESVFEQGWGLANLEYDIPITPATVFDAASVSKQFTAFAVARLIQQGKLSLEDDIRKYLPDMPDYGTTITLRHLLSHASGLRDQWTLLALAGKPNGDVVSQADTLNIIERQRELLFRPGERFLYCNSGYTLLSEIVAKASGKPFGDFTRDEIFEPLGMTNSHFHTNCHEVVKNMAYGYSQSNGDNYRKGLLNYETVGATGLFTTVEDLAKWIANLEHPKPGLASPLELMQQPGRLNSGEKLDYGMGLFLEDYRGARLIQHGGAQACYRSFVLWFPDLHLGVALLGNLASLDNREIAITAAEIFLGDQLQPVKPTNPGAEWPTVKLSPRELDRYAGIYELYSRLTEISRVGDHLRILEDNYPPEVLTANGNGRFSSGTRTFIFQVAKSGPASEFTDNWKENFKRLEATEEKQPDLNAYAGDYWSSELETFLRISRRKARLMLGFRPQGEVPLRYVARNLFVSASDQNWWFELKFQRDSKKAVGGVRLNGILFKRRQLE
jgi:CubicO group peptidase (beta-lactamase class C family)